LQEIDDYDAFLSMVEQLEGWEGIATNTGYLNLGYIYNPEFVEMTRIFQIYPDKSRELPRKPLIMEMVFDGSNYVLINNHLKCCGDGIMNSSDPWDEETRRYDACVLLEEYINENYPDDNVILLGDLNDLLTDSESNNVFQVFFDNPDKYLATDMAIAQGTSADWSYPSWPSHLDHIFITNELFEEFEAETSVATTLRIDDYLENGFWEYEQNVSDHRPVAFKFAPQQGSSGIFENRTNDFEIHVYPNPADDFATFSFEPAGKNTSLEIIDFNGRKITEQNLQQGQTSFGWECTDLAPGMYWIRIKSDGRSFLSTKAVVVK
jgi:hypothetical protein